MPRSWHDRYACSKIDEDEKRALYKSISADKKPYFMRYIYPDLARQYNTYIGNTNKNALRSFDMTVEEMQCLPFFRLTDEQKNFLHYYDIGMPVGLSDCVMNKICRAFEKEFDNFFRKKPAENYDYASMRNNSVQYTNRQYNAIRALYDDYTNRVSSYMTFAKYERIDEDDTAQVLINMKDELRRACHTVCQNEDILCDIILDICYKRKSSKRFAWDMCGHSIIHNMLTNNNNKLSFPVADENGDIEFSGNRFSIVELEVLSD